MAALVLDVLQPEVVPFLQGIPGAILGRIMHAHILQNGSRLLFSPTVVIFNWSAYSLAMSPIEHMWDLVG